MSEAPLFKRPSGIFSVALWLGAPAAFAREPDTNTSIFSTVSTPANDVHSLAIFVLLITGAIFLSLAALLTYALIRYRARTDDPNEPAQVFGSTQIELAWTIIPILLITVLFLGTGRVIFAVQDAPKPPSAIDVVAIGHRFWWEYRYPKYGIVTANELHVPISDPKSPTPTFLKLTSADVMHSYWVPRLAGKTDLIPNRVNEMWIEPHELGLFQGQCAQFCGTEHAKMLLRVYVDTPEQFAAWVKQQQAIAVPPPLPPTSASIAKPNDTNPANTPTTGGDTPAAHREADTSLTPATGRQVFEQVACINCHRIAGTVADGDYGPDLTHLMSRQTIAAGTVPNTPENINRWITNPDVLKPGCLMPAMHLTKQQNDQIVAYLTTLH